MPSPDESGRRTLIGNGLPYPPLNGGREWALRRKLNGAVMKPADELQVVYGVSIDATASADSLRIEYRVSGSDVTYAATTSTRVVVYPKCASS